MWQALVGSGTGWMVGKPTAITPQALLQSQKKFWHPEAKSQLLSMCALQVLLPISYKKMLALINTVVCSLEWPENG